MNRKHYQWLALGVLVMAPLLTVLLSNYLPGRRELDHPIDLSAPAAPPAGPVAIMPADPPPPAPTQQPSQSLSPDAPAFDASPTLDTNGIAATGLEFGTDEATAAAQPVAPIETPPTTAP